MSQENETILLDDRNLVAEFKLDGNALDTSGNGYNGTASNVLYTKTDRGYQSQCGVFNGSSSSITRTANISAIQSFSFTIYPTANNRTVYTATGISVSINSSSQLASTGLTSPVFYVNGVQTTAITLNAWNHCVVLHTSVNYASFNFGASSFLGNAQTLRPFNGILSEKEIRNRFLHSLRMAGGSSLATLSDGLVSYLDSSDGNELSDIVGGKDGTKVSGTATTDNLGYTRAITNPNYTFPSITYTNVYSYENSGGGWGLVANPSGISATAINRTTTFRLALFFNRALSSSEQTAWAEILAKRYVLPFDVDGRKSLPSQLKEGCVLFVPGVVNGTTAYDASGSGNDGTLVNSPVPTRGALSGYGGLKFNGSNTGVTLGTKMLFSTAYSMGWNVNLASLPASGAFQFLSSRVGVSFQTGFYVAFYNNGGTMEFSVVHIDLGGATDLRFAYPFVAGRNYRLFITWDGTDVRFYVNGRLAGTQGMTRPGTTTTNEYWFGIYGNAMSLPLNGVIANPYVNTSAITSDKINMDAINFFIPT